MNKESNITQGQIWIVNTDRFITSGRSNNFSRGILLKKYELIEIRYPFEWHFRTIDNNYWHAETSEILTHCKLFGKVWGNVSFSNIADLKDIINLSLYSPEKENSYVWAKNLTQDQLKKWKLENLIKNGKENKK